jgi:hypothetical protein
MGRTGGERKSCAISTAQMAVRDFTAAAGRCVQNVRARDRQKRTSRRRPGRTLPVPCLLKYPDCARSPNEFLSTEIRPGSHLMYGIPPGCQPAGHQRFHAVAAKFGFEVRARAFVV